jgi:anti-sigma B factor antagonist
VIIPLNRVSASAAVPDGGSDGAVITAKRVEPVPLQSVPAEPANLKAVAKLEPANLKAVKLEAVKPEPAQSEAVKPEPAQSEAVKPEPAQSEAVKPEPAQSEAVKLEPAQSEAVKLEPVQSEAVQLELSCRTDADGNQVVSVTGELDIATTEQAYAYISEVIDSRPTPVSVDLSGLTFCDASGLGVLAKIARHARQAGRQLKLTSVRPPQLKIMRLTGLDGVFPELRRPVPAY